jgi:hypothetical protein
MRLPALKVLKSPNKGFLHQIFEISTLAGKAK